MKRKLNLLIAVVSAMMIVLSIVSCTWIFYGYFMKQAEFMSFLWQSFYIISFILITLCLIITTEYITLKPQNGRKERVEKET